MKIKEMTKSEDPGSFMVGSNIYLKWWTTPTSNANDGERPLLFNHMYH